MQIRDRAGQSVHLTPVRYEFPDASPSSDWDADWLVIEGEVVSAGGTRSFQDSPPSARECPGLGAWLTQVTEAGVPETEPDDRPSWTFLEPSLAFSVGVLREPRREAAGSPKPPGSTAVAGRKAQYMGVLR